VTVRVKVAHVPARTPYARKLACESFEPVNRTRMARGEVPRDLTVDWVLAHRPFDWFDVLHLHHVEFEDLHQLRTVVAACHDAGRQVVFTAHDVLPIFGDTSGYKAKLAALADFGVPFVCLTDGSRQAVEEACGAGVVMAVIPHGYVVPPASMPPTPTVGRPARHFLLGSLRANRDVATVLYNWRFGVQQRASNLLMLLRAPGPRNLDDERKQWDLLVGLAAGEARLRVDVMPFPADADVAEAAVACDTLVLPYRWGCHSGQLELAFDLGLLPVASSVGYLRDQRELHGDLVPDPVWFDWSDGSTYAYGERILAALDAALERLPDRRERANRTQFAEHRLAEHERILAAYRGVYES
jgi:hypothetical protein